MSLIANDPVKSARVDPTKQTASRFFFALERT